PARDSTKLWPPHIFSCRWHTVSALQPYVWASSLVSYLDLQCQRFRTLGAVWMLGTSVHLEFTRHLFSQACLGQHAGDGPSQEFGWPPRMEGLRPDPLQPARVPRVVDVLLGAQLSGSEMHLLRIDDHHVIPHVDVWGEGGFVLAAQNAGHTGGQTTQCLAVGIDHIPFTTHFFTFGEISSHVARLPPDVPGR